MIMCDELRADVMGYLGNDTIKTPHLDALAEDSIIFENAYCNTPMCVPSRVSIATGRHALSHGALDNMLRPLDDEVSIYSMLQKEGYITFNHGKWHSNIAPENFGVTFSNNGSHRTQGAEKQVTCFGITDRELRKETTYKRNDGEIPLIIYGTRPSHKDHTLDSVVTKNYLDVLNHLDEVGQPVFGRLSIMDPHTPYFPSEPYASMYPPDALPLPDSIKEDLHTKPVLQRYFHKVRGFDLLEEQDYRQCKAAYYGLVTHVDDRIGQVIDRLKALDLYDDSLIIFTSDHGSMLGEHGYIEKWGHMYEQVMRTPLLIKPPHNPYKGKRLDSFVESIDIMPTILELLNLEMPDGVQGKSLVPYMTGKTSVHKDEVYGQYYCGSLQNTSALMVRDETWKLTYYPEGNAMEDKLLNDHPLKMSPMFEKKDVFGELYHMVNDPDEIHNLFDDPAYATIKESYMAKLENWKKDLEPIAVADTMPSHNDLSLHVLTQGENMTAAQDLLRGEGRLRQLKRKS